MSDSAHARADGGPSCFNRAHGGTNRRELFSYINQTSIWKLSEASRHKSLDTLRGYVRRVDLFNEHAGAAFL